MKKDEKLKIEYQHNVNIVWNLLWIISIITAFVITAIVKNIINFYFGMTIFSVLALTVALATMPIAKRNDEIVKKFKVKK